MKSCVNINLKKDKIIIKIDEESELRDIVDSLKKKVIELKKLYQQEKTPILVTGRALKNKEIEDIQKIIKKAIDVDVDFDIPKMLGLHGIRKTFNTEIATSETKFYRQSLRSGQKIEFEGSIVVLGDVNYGAEVIAGENIVVLGFLRGLAHAGAKGNKNAIIAAGSLESPQVRISNIVKEREKEEIDVYGIKTNAFINEADEIVIE